MKKSKLPRCHVSPVIRCPQPDFSPVYDAIKTVFARHNIAIESEQHIDQVFKRNYSWDCDFTFRHETTDPAVKAAMKRITDFRIKKIIRESTPYSFRGIPFFVRNMEAKNGISIDDMGKKPS